MKIRLAIIFVALLGLWVGYRVVRVNLSEQLIVAMKNSQWETARTKAEILLWIPGERSNATYYLAYMEFIGLGSERNIQSGMRYLQFLSKEDQGYLQEQLTIKWPSDGGPFPGTDAVAYWFEPTGD